MDAPTEVVLSFRYRLTQAPDYESGEYSQALVSADGTFYGARAVDYVAQVVRDGNGGSERTTGWQLFEVNLGTLSSGEHVLTVGGYNKKTCRDEFTEVLVDNVVLAERTPVPLTNRLGRPSHTPVVLQYFVSSLSPLALSVYNRATMRIHYLSLTNFRNYARLELALPERPLLLHGANAQGKTSLLEAVYVLATGSSPLTPLDRQLIKWQAEAEGLPYARLWAEVVRQDRVQEVEIVLEKKSLANGTARLQKTIRVDRARKRRADLVGRLNVVLFMPQDVALIAGPPARRRRYLDTTLCQVSAPYCAALDRYTEALRQRNAVLRHLRDEGGDPAQLAPFEEVLAREGVVVANGRRESVAALSQCADRIHQQLTGGAEWLRLEYRPHFDPAAPPALKYQMGLGLRPYEGPPPGVGAEGLVEAFQQALRARRGDEIARGMTLTGPHRDEMCFIAGSPGQGTHEVDLGVYGSRGQQRSAVLALKLAELEWMREKTGESPVLLLDEVLAELDAARRRYLLAQVDGVEQALLTATDPEMFSVSFRERAALWEVRGAIVEVPEDRGK